MGTKRVAGRVGKKRRADAARVAKASTTDAVSTGEPAGGVESNSGMLQLVGKRRGRPALKLADALKSKAKKKAFAKQQLNEARVAVLDDLPKIVKALSAKSAESYLTAKFLFDFAELEKISIETGNPGRPSSFKSVLKKLGFEDRRCEDRIEKDQKSHIESNA